MKRVYTLTISVVCCCLIPEIIGQFTASISGQQYTELSAERQLVNLRYNSSLITWKEAVSSCNRDRNGSLLPVTRETDVQFVHRLKQKYKPDAVWVGDSMVFNATFIPSDGYTVKRTDKCVALQITSIRRIENGRVIVEYDLTVQLNRVDELRAMCVCRKASGPMTLTVESDKHSWYHYKNNNCGNNCKLWAPPFHKVIPADFDTVVGEGNVTLGGLSSDLQVGELYWVNVVASLEEKPRIGSGSIMECGYIESYMYTDNIVFGSCNDKRGFLCESDARYAYDTTSRSSIDSVTEQPEQNNNETENYLQASDGLSTIGYAGIISGVVIVVVISIGLIVAWKICRGNSVSDAENLKPTGGRSFMRTKPSQEQGDGNGSDSQDDNRVTMYAKVDPSRLRNTLNLSPMHSAKHPDINLSEAGGWYLPMNGHAISALNDTYDVIGKNGRAVEGDYDELHRSSNIYNVSSVEMESDSVYDTTLDRHPSKRKLIVNNSYDTLDCSWSVSMVENVCKSVNMEAENYSNHKEMKIPNPTYDRIVIK